jgi:triosephosphate isomerase (TIM)
MSMKPALPRGPLFELGLKGYVWGRKALDLAKAADRIAAEHRVTLIFTPQYVDIAPIARETKRLLVFAQHVDPLPPGRGNGAVLPEAVKEAGACGTFLNHAEKQITLAALSLTIRRCHEVGLFTMVCADSPEEAAALAHLKPTMIMAEPPDLIGGQNPVARNQNFIAATIAAVRRIDRNVLIFNSAGIRTPEDASAVIAAGADGTGSTSGVLTSPDPAETLRAMVVAVEKAWRARQNTTAK